MAAGGTGGHMFPAQALAEVMLAKGWKVTLSTDARGARYADAFPAGVEIQQVASATFARGGALAKAIVPFKLAAGIVAAMARFIAARPSVVIGFGGYPSIPAISAAWALRIPRIIHEQNGVLGRVNGVFAPRVNVIACGTWPTKLPAGLKGTHTGNPVRAQVSAHAAAPYPSVADPPSILAMGGSQGARILSDVVPAAIAQLGLAEVKVAHQARPEDLARVIRTYDEAGINAEVEEFFPDIAERIARAHLVISRAGASSVADISVIGRPSILIPFAAATADHQTANAAGLVAADAAILIPESKLDADTLAAHISTVLKTPGAGAQMSENALALGMPDAAHRLAEIIETLAEKRT